jgi:hypothetical protein
VKEPSIVGVRHLLVNLEFGHGRRVVGHGQIARPSGRFFNVLLSGSGVAVTFTDEALLLRSHTVRPLCATVAVPCRAPSGGVACF